jgi:phage tail-like protein
MRKAVVTLAVVIGTVSSLGTETAAQRSVLAHRFVVSANNCEVDLGSWSKATGLAVTFDLAEYRSRYHANSFRRRLHASFDNGTVTLSRAASSERALVQEWLAQLAQSHDSATTLHMTLIDGSGEPVTSWELTGVIPLHWQISAFDAGQSKVATETLVLAHAGFIVERSTSGC